MRILFVNDDGYDAQGLHAVADLFKDEHEIAVVAPDTQKSGYSHSITIRPGHLKWRKVDGYSYDVYAVSGTPVDCVKLGLSYFFVKPDLVVSGINNGENLGTDILYSGTVSAACDAASLGVRSVALSIDKYDAERSELDECAAFFKRNIGALLKLHLPRTTCLNINFPAGKPLGVKVVKMSTVDTFKDVYDADGELLSPNGHRDYSFLSDSTDESCCHGGYITITPLTTDRTDYETLKKIKKEKFAL